ncbi:MAG: flippase-like domain-containing protein [Bacteroidales bacterium]|nr:flippase-like domain-containing protein [Bacteroidales bacterium]
MKAGVKKYLKLILKIAVTATALFFVFSRIEGKKLLESYGNLSLMPLFAALAMFMFSKLVAAIRLNVFLKSSGIVISEKENVRLYLLGMFYNVFLPGGISGDGYKIYLLKKKFNVPAGRVFSAVLVDRISGVLALFTLSVIIFYFIDFASFARSYAWLLIPLGGLSFFLVVSRFRNDFRAIALGTSLLSLGVQSSQLICAWLIMQSLNMTGRETEYLFVFLISSIVAILPVTVGGIGSREVTFLFGAGVLGLDANLSISLSLMFYFITLAVSLTGAFFVFREPLRDYSPHNKPTGQST